jgi:hypothetical protein
MLARATFIGLTLLVIGLPAWAQSAPAVDNERVTVWDVRLAKGATGPITPHDMDVVIMFLEGGKVRTERAGHASTVASRTFGDVLFVPKGSDQRDTVLSDGGAHEVVIALKDHPGPAIVNDSNYPAAFPRPGSVKRLDNARVVVWRYSWKVGTPTPMHFHDKDVVVAYRYDGSLKSVTPDGASVVNPYKAGDIRFNRGNRAHYEELTTDRQSAVMAELK